MTTFDSSEIKYRGVVHASSRVHWLRKVIVFCEEVMDEHTSPKACLIGALIGLTLVTGSEEVEHILACLYHKGSVADYVRQDHAKVRLVIEARFGIAD